MFRPDGPSIVKADGMQTRDTERLRMDMDLDEALDTMDPGVEGDDQDVDDPDVDDEDWDDDDWDDEDDEDDEDV